MKSSQVVSIPKLFTLCHILLDKSWVLKINIFWCKKQYKKLKFIIQTIFFYLKQNIFFIDRHLFAFWLFDQLYELPEQSIDHAKYCLTSMKTNMTLFNFTYNDLWLRFRVSLKEFFWFTIRNTKLFCAEIIIYLIYICRDLFNSDKMYRIESELIFATLFLIPQFYL